jgi:hypothetical protein
MVAKKNALSQADRGLTQPARLHRIARRQPTKVHRFDQLTAMPAEDSVMTPQTAAASSEGQAILKAENSIETYQTIAEWIRFADAKAAVVLTANGVLVGLLIPTLKTYLGDKTITHPTESWTILVLVLFLGWLLFLILSAASAFLCILPLRGTSRQLTLTHATHFHPAAVAQKYSLSELDRFLADCDKIGPAGLQREILAAVLIDSHLSNAKYRYVTRCIWCLAISVGFACLYLLAIQF